MTYSIVARDPETGDLGVAVQSKFLAVGNVVPWARAGVGAIATQAFANVEYGPRGLELLAEGNAADEALRKLVAADDGREHRQAGVVDAQGRSATYTGRECFAWAGGRTGPNFAAQGNILADAPVVDGIVDTFLAGGRPFPELLVACLAAAESAGGDRRGSESASLVIVRDHSGFGGGNDRWIDLRVDDHADPVPELIRIRAVWRTLMERPEPGDLIAIDAPLAAELRERLTRRGWGPDAVDVDAAFQARMRAELGAVPRIGEARPAIDGWEPDWDAALLGWIGVANLEARSAAPGWIDPAVLAAVREASDPG